MGLLEIGKLVAQHSTTPAKIQEKINNAELEQLITTQLIPQKDSRSDDSLDSLRRE
jgi:hypothetical protein